MREKRARSQDKSEPLFDYQLTDADFDEPFIIDVSGVPAGVLQALCAESRQLDELDASQAVRVPRPPQDGAAPELAPLPVADDDPLHPDLFVGHHRRMEREERRMQVLERQQLIATAAKVRQQREQLLKPEWRYHIERIVKIYDSSNTNEVKRKRELALAEIQQFLAKFDEYNARYNRRESKPEDQERKRLLAQQKRAKAAKQKSSKLRKAQQQVLEQSSTGELDDNELTLSFRPVAFGFMLPTRQFPPREYALPAVLQEEVAAYDVAEKACASAPWLDHAS